MPFKSIGFCKSPNDTECPALVVGEFLIPSVADRFAAIRTVRHGSAGCDTGAQPSRWMDNIQSKGAQTNRPRALSRNLPEASDYIFLAASLAVAAALDAALAAPDAAVTAPEAASVALAASDAALDAEVAALEAAWEALPAGSSAFLLHPARVNEVTARARINAVFFMRIPFGYPAFTDSRSLLDCLKSPVLSNRIEQTVTTDRNHPESPAPKASIHSDQHIGIRFGTRNR